MRLHRISHALLLLFVALVSHPRSADSADRLAAARARAGDVANLLQDALDPDQRGRVTMAAGVLDDGELVIATSEEDDRLRSPVKRIRDAERASQAFGGRKHAEEKILDYAKGDLFRSKKKVLAVAAGRPICERCEALIVSAGAVPASACRSGRRY